MVEIMKTFSKYYEEMGLGDISNTDESEILNKIAEIAIRNHQDKVMQFFEFLSKHDESIKTELDKYKDKRNSYMPTDQKDVIIPNAADSI